MQKREKQEAAVRYEEIRCNRCGKMLQLEQGEPREEFVSVDQTWGYFSGMDGQRMRFDLCEACVRELAATFVIPPEIAEVSELL